MDQFPGNSKKAETHAPSRRVERVTSGQAVRRRPSLRKQFSNTFIGGDANTAGQYMIFNVLIPAAKEALVEAMSSGFEKLIYGDSRPRRGGHGPSSGPMGYVSYHRMGPQKQERPSSTPRMLSRSSRSRQRFDDIVIPSRQEAEEVMERLYDLISKYEFATLADLYELTGLQSTHTDHKWGWMDLRGASIGRVRGGGYLLDLPDPEPLD